MQFFPIQIAIFIFGFYWFNSYFKMGLKYYCLFTVPFYSMPLVYFSVVTTYFRPLQLLMLITFLWIVGTNQPLKKSVVLRAFLMLSPFIASLIYNYFFFTPIRVWAINNRFTHNGIQLAESLTLTNITQLIYIIFGAVSMILMASLKFDQNTCKKTIEISVIVVSLIGLFQVAAYYLGVNTVFRLIFSNVSHNMPDQVFWLWGAKEN